MSLEGKTQEEIVALAALSNSVLQDARTRGTFQRMVKAVNPKVSVPEIELEDRVAAVIKPVAEENARLRAESEQSKAQNAANALFESLRDDGVVRNRAEFGALVQFAAKEGFQTNAAGLKKAAAHQRASTEVAEPTTSALGVENLRVDKDKDKDLVADPIGWGRSTAAAAINELRSRAGGR